MSNQQNDFNKRSKRPQTIASAMGDLMSMFGIRASDADLVKRWDKIIHIATFIHDRRNKRKNKQIFRS